MNYQEKPEHHKDGYKIWRCDQIGHGVALISFDEEIHGPKYSKNGENDGNKNKQEPADNSLADPCAAQPVAHLCPPTAESV